MSYIPELLINYNQLHAKGDEIYNISVKQRANRTKKYPGIFNLLEALNYDPIEFPEIKLLLLAVDLTSLNKNVRDILNKLEIEFRTIN